MGAYDQDFHAWALSQAEAIRRRSFNELDWENLAEEVESLGRQQRSELRSRYEVLLMHLLKGIVQEDWRSRSWELTVREQRTKIQRHLDENPSLKSVHGELFDQAYQTARLVAARETGIALSQFPETPPFSVDQAIDETWLPD